MITSELFRPGRRSLSTTFQEVQSNPGRYIDGLVELRQAFQTFVASVAAINQRYSGNGRASDWVSRIAWAVLTSLRGPDVHASLARNTTFKRAYTGVVRQALFAPILDGRQVTTSSQANAAVPAYNEHIALHASDGLRALYLMQLINDEGTIITPPTRRRTTNVFADC